jgi:hypothetical protein
MRFQSFEDAHMSLGLAGSPRYSINVSSSGEILSLKLIDSFNSYNKILNNGNVVWYIGFGMKNVQGSPIGNQNEEAQLPFFSSKMYGSFFPILRERRGMVEIMGNYRIVDIVKKISFSGFAYYHIKMHKAHDKPLLLEYREICL